MSNSVYKFDGVDTTASSLPDAQVFWNITPDNLEQQPVPMPSAA